MHDPADPIAIRLAEDPTDSITNSLIASDPELKKILLEVAETNRRWCLEVLQGTEITAIEGHALFRSLLTPDTAKRLGVELRQRPKEHREILAPFRSYTVPRASRDTCGTCDATLAELDANMAAESVRRRLSTKYGADRYIVRVDEMLTAEHGANTHFAFRRQNPQSGGSFKPIRGIFVIALEEAR